ncbi:HWE histidine kinase domain-containing protein [Pseudotabrizicola sp. 4114]|uniref:sensor histidine kinase n=1 Tax=Pseudotabrizicola sp. 4114 TaxID=2817731 RepID=UPI00286341BD|nr:two-component sensor histidine kinase [Pseudorhodobacter sp. 4114]
MLPTILIIILNLMTMRQEREAEMHDQALRVARAAALEVDRIIGGAEAVLHTIVARPVSSQSNDSDCAAFLANVVVALPQLLDLTLIDASGHVWCSSSAPPHRVYLGDRSYFSDALAQNGRVVGEFTEMRVAQGIGLPIAIPAGAGSGLNGGVAVAMLDLTWLAERLKERAIKDLGSLTVADRNGRILTREPFPERFVGTVIPDDYLPLVTALRAGTKDMVSQDGTRRIIGYLPATGEPAQGLYISAGLSTETGYAAINQLTWRGALIGTAGIVAAFVLANITSNVFIRQPFKKMIATIEAWQRDEVTQRTGMGADLAEFGRAGRALDAFMDLLTSARAKRREAEQQRELLMHELDHRVKNLLATVQAVARQTFRGADPEAASRIFAERLAAMGGAHKLLMNNPWQSARIRDLILAAIAPFEDSREPRFALSGPQFEIDAKAAMAISMGLHELCTNAAKYGALRERSGRIVVSWQITDAPEPDFALTWEERNGPTVTAPTHKGFGSTMIEQVMAMQINGQVTMTYEPSGLHCRITAPLTNLRHAAQCPASSETPAAVVPA